jgi:hypothetical protein
LGVWTFYVKKQSINGEHYTQCHLLAKTNNKTNFQIIYKFRMNMLGIFDSHGANNYITLSVEAYDIQCPPVTSYTKHLSKTTHTHTHITVCSYCELDPVPVFCEHGKEFHVFINDHKFLDQQGNYQLLLKFFPPQC